MNIIGLYGFNQIKTGGHKRYVELLYQLHQKGHIIILIAPEILGPLKEIEEDVIHINIKDIEKNIIPFSFKLLFLSIFAFIKFKRSRQVKADNVLIFGITNLWSGLFLKIATKKPLTFGLRSNIIYNHKKVKEYRNFLIKFYKNLRYCLIKLALSFVDSIVVQNTEEKIVLDQNSKVKSENIYVVRNNLNVSWLREDLALSNSSNKLEKILFVGTLSKRKNVFFLIKAFEKTIEDNGELKLSIAGEGPRYNEILRYAKDRKVDSYINLLGFVDNPLQVIKRHDLIVVPSIVDPCPNVILEALYVGTPVIGSKTYGISNLLEREELLFDLDSPENLTEKINELKNQKYYCEVKELCIEQRSKLNFDWSGEFEKILNEISV